MELADPPTHHPPDHPRVVVRPSLSFQPFAPFHVWPSAESVFPYSGYREFCDVMSLLRRIRRRNRGRDAVISSWREIWIQLRRDEPVGRGPELRLRSEDRRTSAGSARQVDGVSRTPRNQSSRGCDKTPSARPAVRARHSGMPTPLKSRAENQVNLNTAVKARFP